MASLPTPEENVWRGPAVAMNWVSYLLALRNCMSTHAPS